MKTFTKFQAAYSLVGPNIWGTDDEVYYDSDQTPPTDAEIDAELIRLQTEYDALEYARKREAEYPSIQECVHAILDDDLDAHQAKRASIKDTYPKPE